MSSTTVKIPEYTYQAGEVAASPVSRAEFEEFPIR